MSVSAILGADGKIAAAFLPTGTANAYVDNPMTEDLDCNGFNIVNLDDITVSSNLRSKSHDVLNNAGIVQASFTYGTNATSPSGTGVLLKGNPPTLMNLLVDGSVGCGGVVSGAEVDTNLVSLPAGLGAGVGLEFVSPTNELYVKYTDGVGLSLTSAGGTANIDTTGEVSAVSMTSASMTTGLLAISVGANSFIGDKSLVAGTGTVVAPAITAQDLVFITPQCQNVVGTAVYYTAVVNAGVGFTITSRTLSTGAPNGTDTSTVGFVVIRAAA